MEGLFARQLFTGFGRLALLPDTEPPLHMVKARRPGRLRALMRRNCPRLPGVYGMLDPKGELIYIGKAKSLRTRLLSYFRPRSRDPKAGRILKRTRTLVWEVAASEFAALLRELELIQRWQPRFNVQGQPSHRRRVYVCVGRQPAATVFLAKQPPRTALAGFGPVPAGLKVREAMRRLNDWFRLRDCPQTQQMSFADQRELFALPLTPGCIRHEIGNCLGPCAAACSRDAYADSIQAALAFLSGDDATPLTLLEREMAIASANLAFERAAALRDKLESLTWLSEQLRRVREASRHAFVYPVHGHDEAEWWYLIHGGRVRAVVPSPSDEMSRQEAARRIQEVYGRRSAVAGPPGPGEMDGVILVAAWFRRRKEQQRTTLEPAAALDRCRPVS
ncbi:MAG TPA: UvrB/UvrC motif-containing protein [Gemmataceae bacterium]|nr:UvrB/UvrC motif-containing protein [Gemmataceae bacterium]